MAPFCEVRMCLKTGEKEVYGYSGDARLFGGENKVGKPCPTKICPIHHDEAHGGKTEVVEVPLEALTTGPERFSFRPDWLERFKKEAISRSHIVSS